MVTRIERSILSWVEEHLTLLAVLLFSVLGIALRLPLMDFISGDSTFFLLPWSRCGCCSIIIGLSKIGFGLFIKLGLAGFGFIVLLNGLP